MMRGLKMRLVNVIYGNDYNDVDLILVPQWVAQKIYDYVQEFCDWLITDPDQTYKRITNEGLVSYICETDGFIDWLNKHIIKSELEKATIVSQHLNYNPELPSAEF